MAQRHGNGRLLIDIGRSQARPVAETRPLDNDHMVREFSAISRTGLAERTHRRSQRQDNCEPSEDRSKEGCFHDYRRAMSTWSADILVRSLGIEADEADRNVRAPIRGQRRMSARPLDVMKSFRDNIPRLLAQ